MYKINFSKFYVKIPLLTEEGGLECISQSEKAAEKLKKKHRHRRCWQ